MKYNRTDIYRQSVGRHCWIRVNFQGQTNIGNRFVDWKSFNVDCPGTYRAPCPWRKMSLMIVFSILNILVLVLVLLHLPYYHVDLGIYIFINFNINFEEVIILSSIISKYFNQGFEMPSLEFWIVKKLKS